MVLNYSYCNVSVLPLRKEASHCSEQVSQMLFGEKAEILDIKDNEWAKIRCQWDEYEGWCRLSQLSIISRKEFFKEAKYFSIRNSDKIIFEDSEMWLPAGSELSKSKIGIDNETGVFKGKKTSVKEIKFSYDSLMKAVKQYLHAPYQWGGRSVAGIDCSGLTQMVFKLCNKKISRDASLQASEGTTLDFLQHAQCGDLAFFDNAEGRINHVGLLIDAENIIHATDVAGCVVIDKIDHGGIISKQLKKRTHTLRLVKRYF